MCAGFPGGLDSKESACNAGDPHSITGWGRFPGEGNGNPLQWSCREFHRQRSPAGYGPWGCKESDMTEWLTHTHTHKHTHTHIYLSKIIWNCWVYKNGNFIYFNSWVIIEYIFSHLFLLGSLFPLFPLPPYPVYISSTLPFSHIPRLFSSHWQFTFITVYVSLSILMESWTQVSGIAGRFFPVWASREGPWNHKQVQIYLCICVRASHQTHCVKPQTSRLLFSLLKVIAKYSNSCIWIIFISSSWHLSLRDFSLVLSSCFTFLILIHLNSLSFITC